MGKITYKSIVHNSRLTDFSATKELVLQNAVPTLTVATKKIEKLGQSNLFEFC